MRTKNVPGIKLVRILDLILNFQSRTGSAKPDMPFLNLYPVRA